MFNRYWRDYPWWMQIMQFGLMVFIFLGFASGLAYILLPALTGTHLADIANVSELSPKPVINGMILFQFITSLFFFLLPSLVFAYATHPAPFKYLGLRKPGKPVHWLLVSFIILGLMPVSIAFAGWISHFNLGDMAQKMQSDNDRITKAFLQMSSPGSFVATFITIAILPAIGEELFFRGIIMRFTAQKTPGILMSLLVSALLFAFLHSNIYGILSIFLDGIVLGLIYYLTGSLWCSILAHFINNGLQVALIYLAKNSPAIDAIANNNQLPWYMPVAGILVFAISMYLLWKNRTPLPADWTDDFAGEVRSDEEESGSY